MSPLEHKRMKWRCRRGLLELDLVLERYVARYPGDCGLLPLLDLPDPELWEIVCGRSDAYPAGQQEVVARLRAV